MRTRKSSSNYKSHLKLFKPNSRRLLSDLSPNPIPRTSIDVRLFYLDPYSHTEYSICRPIINFIRFGQISYVQTELKTPYRQRFLNITIHLLRLKIQNRSNLRTIYFESRAGNYFPSEIKLDSRSN
jgi:hypothetical protein